jgi:hypothetical protein
MLMNRLFRNPLVRAWLAIVGVATLVLGAAYTMAQQSTRLSADDLPLTTSQVAKQELQSGSDTKDVVPTLKTNLRNDTSIFMIITDSTQHILASSAVLDGKTPLPPKGVFDYTNAHGSDRFTWEPSKGVRVAARVTTYHQAPDNGFIITGQSLKPFEDRISTFGLIALAALIASIAWSFLFILLPAAGYKPPRPKKS